MSKMNPDKDHEVNYENISKLTKNPEVSVRVNNKDPRYKRCDNNQPVKGHEKDISGNKYKSRFYCIDCSKFIADEVVGYDSNEYPVVHHNNGHKHSVIFGADIKRLLELGISQVGQSTRYETAEMYGIPVEKLEQVLANIGKGV